MSTAGFDEIDFSDETEAKSVGSAGVDTESTVTTVTAVAVEKRGGKKKPVYVNCNVCTSSNMASGSKYCKVHKETVEEMAKTLSQHAVEQGKESSAEKAKVEFFEARDQRTRTSTKPILEYGYRVRGEVPTGRKR